MANLREEMKQDNQAGLQRLREELSNIHSQEMQCLKTQHDQCTAELKADALDHEKASVENAVTLVRAECEQQICQLVSQHNEKMTAMHTDAIQRMNVETAILRGELNNAQFVAEEVPGLKCRINGLIDSEKKLQSEVRRLQASLNSSSSSAQSTIDELKRENNQLHYEIREINQVLDNRVKQNNDLMRLLAMVGDQKSSMESDLKEVEEKCRKMCKEIESKNGAISKLNVELSESKQAQIDLSEQISLARAEIIHLSQYKHHVEQSHEHIIRLRTELEHVKAKVKEMNHFYTSSQSSITEWRDRLRGLHFAEVTQLKDQTALFQGEMKRLEAIKHNLEQRHTLSMADKETIEQRLKYMEQAAVSAANAHSGERLSWEKAMDELKVKHRKEKLHIQLVSQDEQDIMRNKIVQLELEKAKQEEHHERKCQILEADFLHKVEGLNAALSKSKYESVIEIQKMAKDNIELQEILEAEKEQCVSLSLKNEDLVRQINLLNEKHEKEIERLRHNHMQEQEESTRDHAQRFQQLEQKLSSENEALSEQLGTVKQDMHILVHESQRKIATIKECAASAHQSTIEAKDLHSDLKCLSRQLCDTKSAWEQCANEVSYKLRNMRQTCIEIVNQEKMDAQFACDEALSKLNDSYNLKVEAATKEAADAKKMLFQSIREHEMKLEREIRLLKEEHSSRLSSVVKENEDKCGELSSKLKNLHAEFDSVVATGVKQKEELSEKEKMIGRIEKKIIDLTKLHNDEMRSVQSKHQSEQASLMRDNLSKEALMEAKFAEERTRLQTSLDEVSDQLNEAKEQLQQTTLNEAQNESQIISLQEKVDTLSKSQEQTREKMMFFKLELENRETNFNRRFSTASERGGTKNTAQEYDNSESAGVLRVIQSSPKINAKGMTNIGMKKIQKEQQEIRRQGRRTIGTSKKESKTKKTTTALPKIATSITTESKRR
ncbi:hypothetical protein HJC23_007509 [Cyclotella cryptica]|uniref:Uncharacterized protein n=1 Tax=Cyclotella cryptica TaxID=29204 RepID=A0ABD3PUS8_9STRA|eukprot:CCRYP_011416-RA/>CCRYP_011416-RA protein AED:0.20 eAED:0.20 QI:639/1/0.33/1/1/1/3/0/948